MDAVAGERLNEAFTRKEISIAVAPDQAGLDSLLEPLGVQTEPKVIPSSSSAASTKEGHFLSSFLSCVSSEGAELARLLRRTAGCMSGGTDEFCPQLRSPPDNLQQRTLTSLTLLAAALTGLWGWRTGRSIERIVAGRYSDIAYQIRRPDSLSARISAFKVLVLGGLVLPGSAVAVVSWQACLQRSQPTSAARVARKQTQTHCLLRECLPTRRAALAEMLPLAIQNEMRRLASLFHSRMTVFVEAVAPSKQKWKHWAAGVRASHISGINRPSLVVGGGATWDRMNSSP